jgi:hypothetical protein
MMLAGASRAANYAIGANCPSIVMAGEGPPSTTSRCPANESRGWRAFARHEVGRGAKESRT